ncbi:MAG: sugar ABC transporter permease [Bacilli bacterium]|nr:sugar ABC transporter permease [Bacilli bacterium]
MSGVKRFFSNIKENIADFFTRFSNFFKVSNINTKASMCLMGLGQLMYKQIGKGILYLIIEILFLLFFSLCGFSWIVGFFTLGTVEADPWTQQAGDNSVVFMLLGIFSIFLTIFFICIYINNIRDAYETQKGIIKGKKPTTFKEDLLSLLDKKFYKSVLFLPIIGTLIFSILPIVFMILIAFTNYGYPILPPALVDWVGLENFEKIFSVGNISSTFFKILGWNLLWAFSTTFLNYILGLLFALLLNNKHIKGKAFWRLFPILVYAIPGFITLTAFKFLFSQGGPINQAVIANGGKEIPFLLKDGKWYARIIGLCVNAWLTIPSVMLLATGVLSNISNDLYEAARIDGASKFKQFKDITLPFVVFATTPNLITSFIGNFNNFGVFYFLRPDVVSDGYFCSSDTDLLINWLYHLSIDNSYYSIGAAISLIIFIITSCISLIVYIKSPAYKQEDMFR